MTICIAGKNTIAIAALDYLIGLPGNYQLLACINRTDDGTDGWQPSYLAYCRRKNIKVVALEDVYGIENLVFFSLEFDRILKPQLFKSKRLFNIHFSKLPAYKGMFTSVLPILYAEPSSGVTLHTIDRGIDTGEIIDQIAFDIPGNANSQDLYYLYLNNAVALFKKCFQSIVSGNYKTLPQAIEGASYYSKDALNFKNLPLNFNKTAFEIKNQIRAFAFRAYQLPTFNGSAISHAVCLAEKSTVKAGQVLVEDEFSFLLTTIDYNIVLYKDSLSAILEYAAKGNLEELERFKAMQYSFNEKNEKGWNALIVAAYNEQLQACKWLIGNGCDVNAVNNNGTSVLMYAMTAASKSGNLALMKYLVEAGATVNHTDYSGKSFLQYARGYGHAGVIAFVEGITG